METDLGLRVSQHNGLCGRLGQPRGIEKCNGSRLRRRHVDDIGGQARRYERCFSGTFVRSFKGPDSKLFIDRPEGEGRLLFSLNLDFFNPEGNRKHGAHTSTGILAMACLNLPPEIRYKAQNMYIAGIIPGPVEPKLTEGNHFLRPLVDNLEIAWKCGILYTHVTGRLIRLAVACAVCDLPAARKISCLAGVRSDYICSVCKLHGQGELGNLDYNAWRPRDAGELREAAENWKAAPSSSAQKKLFKSFGVRWTELWRLPYWDPSHQLVVDPMHCLLEGLVHRHFRKTLGFTAEEAKIVDELLPAFDFDFPQIPDKAADPRNPVFQEESDQYVSDAELQQVPYIYKVLRQPLENYEEDLEAVVKKMSSRNLTPLKFVARSLGCTPIVDDERMLKLKRPWLDALRDWVR